MWREGEGKRRAAQDCANRPLSGSIRRRYASACLQIGQSKRFQAKREPVRARKTRQTKRFNPNASNQKGRNPGPIRQDCCGTIELCSNDAIRISGENEWRSPPRSNSIRRSKALERIIGK